jgi:uncharacterized damage-inducible protein DinB
MAMRDAFLVEFDHEMATTRRVLERVPESAFAWKPHEKSFSMQQLASHLANIPAWTDMSLSHDSYDVAPPDGESFTTPQAESTDDLLKRFDDNVVTARKAIEATSDEDFMKPWSLMAGGEVRFKVPRVAVLRSFILNHNVHHRGQLTVYLRLNDIAVPSVYGPSADEQPD